MSQSKQWKDWEREVAKALGGVRTGPRGFGLPDVSDLDDLAPECKFQSRLTLRGKDMEQAQINRDNAGKRWWTLFLREGKTGRRVVVLPFEYFVELYNNQKEENV